MRALWLAALALAGCSRVAREETRPPAEAREPGELRVLTFNVRYGTADDGPDAWPERRADVLELVADAHADVVAVQEALAFQLEELQSVLPQHVRVGRGREADGGGEHAALFLDTRRTKLVEHGDFWLSKTPEVPGSTGWDAALPRICTWALVELDGVRVLVSNVHFDHVGELARERSAELVAARSRSSDVAQVVLGDFNAVESSPPIQALAKAGFTDLWRTLHPDASAPGTFHSFRGGIDGPRIDFVFGSERAKGLSCEVLSAPGARGRWPSDHHAVLAVLLCR
ncbi:MAG: endonuclease/exonuclease/phosphatase family protein [Planctomycetota bacterium]|nr:endonuclease/exonuclease/phosphatase family protein [Planctomycetota bacterium]